MIDLKFSVMQVERFAGLDRYPRGPEGKPGRTELALEAQKANSTRILQLVCDSWIANERECPKPSDLRQLVATENSRTEKKRRECSGCGGSGSITGWYLVTYRGNSYNVKNREFLRNVEDPDAAREFGERMAEHPPVGDGQTILSGAVGCVCVGGRSA